MNLNFLRHLNMTTIYTYAGPVGSPMPSAFALGLNLYDFMVKAYPAHPTAAVIASFGGIVGIESTGALSALLMSKAYVNKDKGTAFGAFLLLLAYIVFVIVGIYTGQDSVTMVATVGITLLCYLAQALWQGWQDGNRVKVADQQAVLYAQNLAYERAEKEHAAQIELMKQQAEIERAKAEGKEAEASAERAKARAAKSTEQKAAFSERSVNGTAKEYRYNADTLAKARAIMAEYTAQTGQQISANQLAARLNVQKATGKIYKAKVWEA
jgi:hypothetical protein